MKNQALFSSKDKSKKINMSSAAIFVWRFKGYRRAWRGSETGQSVWLGCLVLFILEAEMYW